GDIDYDGQYVWATIAQYQPNPTATIIRVDLNTCGIVHDISQNTLTTPQDWGSRNFITWS
ncbi:hypothetical protein F5876DRAFT_3915, partial [Lentinula aff. lateritia]